jgi:hypothetical protein
MGPALSGGTRTMAHNRARERGPASTKEPEPPAQPPTGVRVPVPTEVGVRSQAQWRSWLRLQIRLISTRSTLHFPMKSTGMGSIKFRLISTKNLHTYLGQHA